MIRVTCTNVQQHCCHENVFNENDLVSGIAIKDDEGRVIEEHPQVEIDGNTFVQCERCGYPISCANAAISD
jgi:RNA polymerase-binding transcription factor DksA